MPKRRQIREKVLQGIYAWLITNDDPRLVFDKVLSKSYNQLLNNQSTYPIDKFPENDAQFMHDLFFGVTSNYERYIQAIKEKVENWDISRIAPVDKAAMLMALCELENFPTIPVKVTINEYLDISKNFSTPKSTIFVNGVIDAIHLDWLKSGKIKKIEKS
ncbi:MAG: transcription antitermination factor NusB [Candidatus Pacearchaeota archaeon]